MSTPSHDRASLVKAISDVLTRALGNVLRVELAEALAARIALVIDGLMTEREVLSMLANPVCAGVPLTPEIIDERAKNIGQVAWAHHQLRGAA